MNKQFITTALIGYNHLCKLRLLLLCFMAVISLNACGGSDDLTEDKKPSKEQTEEDKKSEEQQPDTDSDKEEEKTDDGTVTVTPPTDHTTWTKVEQPQLPTITTANTFNITDYGALTTAADNTEAVQKALNAAGEAGGGMVVVPAGEWLCGPVVMKSKTKLLLKDGATLKLLAFEDYPIASTNSSGQRQYANFIDCEKNATDICVEGESKTG